MKKNTGARSQKSRESGFTLIETIITLVVLSIAAVGVLSVFTSGMKGSADPLIINQAVSLAQEKVDEVIALRKSGGYNAVGAAAGAFPAPYAAFAWNRAVMCVAAGALNTDIGGAPPCASGYEHVTVTVTHAVIGTVTLDTLVTNY